VISVFDLPRRRAVSILIALACLMAGCGQKGPLYLPSKQEAAPAPAPQKSAVPADSTIATSK